MIYEQLYNSINGMFKILLLSGLLTYIPFLNGIGIFFKIGFYICVTYWTTYPIIKTIIEAKNE